MQESFQIAFRNLSHQKTRTLLTLLGVVIGIAAVVALISLGQGLSASIGQQLEQLGADKIIVTPAASASFAGPPSAAVGLSERDLKAVQSVKGVEIAIPMVFKNLPATYKGQSVSLSLYGVPGGDSEKFFSDVQGYDLAEGRFFRAGEKSVGVIGSRLQTDVFSATVRLRDKITVLGKDIQVIGVTEPVGNQQDDTSMVVPLATLRDLAGNDGEITVIFAKAEGADVTAVAQEIEDDLERMHDDKLFIALTTEQLLERINSVFGIISVVLLGIAAISLLVASFGIMNTMLMAVIERTREIGIMKAVGATNNHILALFLVESSAVGLVGGVVGAILGYAISFGLANISSSMVGIELLVSLDPMLMAGALAFSTLVGTIAGTYPAYRAAKLDPVEALRHE